MDLKELLAKLNAIMDELNKLTADEAAETTDEGKTAKRALHASQRRRLPRSTTTIASKVPLGFVWHTRAELHLGQVSN